MRAFVLGGGGNRGPLEVGAIKALLSQGIVPDMIVGSSAGAINGAVLAIDPTLQQITHMANLWRDAGNKNLLNSPIYKVMWRLFRQFDYVTDNTQLRKYMHKVMTPGVRTFGDLKVPLYVTLCHLLTHTLYVYGDEPSTPIVDAVLASAAVPGAFPPVWHQGECFVDGGVASNVPAQLAVSRGATELWCIDLAFDFDRQRKLKGVFAIGGLASRAILYQAVLRELEMVTHTPGITLHHIPIYGFQDVPLGNFTHTEAMVIEGERVAQAYLAAPKPNQVHYLRHWIASDLPQGPMGARPFLSAYRFPK